MDAAYLSYTGDLADADTHGSSASFVDAAADALRKAGLSVVHSPAWLEGIAVDLRDEIPASMKSCTHFVALVGGRWSPMPADPTASVLQVEFEIAAELGLVRHVFLLEDTAMTQIDQVHGGRQRTLRDRLREDVPAPHTFRSSPQELGRLILRAVGSVPRPPTGRRATRPGALHRGHVLVARLLDYRPFGQPARSAFERLFERVNLFVERMQMEVETTSRGDDAVVYADASTGRSLPDLLRLGIHLGICAEDDGFGVSLLLHSGSSFQHHHQFRHAVGPELAEATLISSLAQEPHVTITAPAAAELRGFFRLVASRGDADLILRRDTALPVDVPPRLVTAAEYAIEEFHVYDFTKTRHDLFNFRLCDSAGNDVLGRPLRRQEHALIEYRDRGTHEEASPFVQRLVEADVVHVVGVTNERLADYLEEALDIRAARGTGFWDHLHVTFPTERVLREIHDQHSDPRKRESLWAAGRNAVTRFLLNRGDSAWTVSEFDANFTFVGNRFQHGRALSSVRISPLLPGVNARESFYIELYEGSETFSLVDESFQTIARRANPIIELDVIGAAVTDSDELCYDRIVNRARLSEVPDTAVKPIALVALHVADGDRRSAVLQVRDEFNAESGFGTYSNISGHITDLDVYRALNTGPLRRVPEEFLSDADATAHFEDRTGWVAGDAVIPRQASLFAAVRECHEETGLRVDRGRFVYHRTYLAPFADERLYFYVYSLELHPEELEEAAVRAPHSNLSRRTIAQIRDLRDRSGLNRLLQSGLDDLFVPIYTELGLEVGR